MGMLSAIAKGFDIALTTLSEIAEESRKSMKEAEAEFEHEQQFYNTIPEQIYQLASQKSRAKLLNAAIKNNEFIFSLYVEFIQSNSVIKNNNNKSDPFYDFLDPFYDFLTENIKDGNIRCVDLASFLEPDPLDCEEKYHIHVIRDEHDLILTKYLTQMQAHQAIAKFLHDVFILRKEIIDKAEQNNIDLKQFLSNLNIDTSFLDKQNYD